MNPKYPSIWMKDDSKAYLYASKWVEPILLSLQTVLSILQILDAKKIFYYYASGPKLRTSNFQLGFELYEPLLVLLLLYVIWMIQERRYSSLLIPSLSLILYTMDLKIALPMGSLLAVINSLLTVHKISEYVSALLMALGGFELLTLLHWSFFIPMDLTSPFITIADVETSINRIFAFNSVIFVLVLILAWLPKSITYLREMGRNATDYTSGFGGERDFWATALLTLSVLLGVIAAVFPYNPILNPQALGVGVDIPNYIEVSEVVETDLTYAFEAYSGSRPLIFMLIWSFQRLIGTDVTSAVNFLPVLLNPLMVLGAFFIGKESSDDWWIGSWAAFFTACSFHVTVGMFAYFLTNMLALSLIFFSLGFLFRALRLKSKRSLVYACLIGSLLVFTHPWTYTQYFVTTLIAATAVGCLAYTNRSDYEETKLLSIYSVALGLSNILKELLLGGYGGVAASSGVIRSVYGAGEFLNRYKFGVMVRYGGYLINVALFLFAILGILSRDKKQTPDIYFTALLFASTPLFFIGEFRTLGRLLYNLPIGLFSAYGFTSILRSQIDEKLKLSLMFFTCLYLTAYLIRSIAILV